jgi:hypothetical protein
VVGKLEHILLISNESLNLRRQDFTPLIIQELKERSEDTSSPVMPGTALTKIVQPDIHLKIAKLFVGYDGQLGSKRGGSFRRVLRNWHQIAQWIIPISGGHVYVLTDCACRKKEDAKVLEQDEVCFKKLNRYVVAAGHMWHW